MCTRCSNSATAKFMCHFGGHEAQEVSYPDALGDIERSESISMVDPYVVVRDGKKFLCCWSCLRRLGAQRSTRLSDECNADFRRELREGLNPKIEYCPSVMETIGYEASLLAAELVA